MAALLASGCPLTLAASHGNTAEGEARRNLSRLRDLAGRRDVAVLEGSSGGSSGRVSAPSSAAPSAASRWLAARREPTSLVALGPLTDLAAALDLEPRCVEYWSQVIAVGGNRRSRGRWPPIWPYEFNLTKDRAATERVLARVERLTFVSLDVARRLRFGRADLERLEGPVGQFLRDGGRRWLRRSLWIKARRSFPVWDLVAALAILRPELFLRERAPVSSGVPLGAYGLPPHADREVTWIVDYDAIRLRVAFDRLLARLSAPSTPPAANRRARPGSDRAGGS